MKKYSNLYLLILVVIIIIGFIAHVYRYITQESQVILNSDGTVCEWKYEFNLNYYKEYKK